MDSNRVGEMQEEIERLLDEMRKLQEISELEKRTNAELEVQISELKEKLKNRHIQMELETNVEIAELNKTIQQLQEQLQDIEVGYAKKLEESRVKQGMYDIFSSATHTVSLTRFIIEKLSESLENEQTKLKRYELQFHDIESKEKMVEELMAQVSQLEKQKMDLASQFEKFSKVADDVTIYKTQISEMNEALDKCERDLEKERADRASVEHKQDDLLQKMKNLQKENDELVVKLEGLKSENDSLLNKNKRLEDRVRVLEGKNKQHLQQVNDTLRMPIPIERDSDVMSAVTAEEVEKIYEIDEQLRKASLECSERSSLHLSSSPPNLTVPSVIVDDEKRPASLGKELKVIPKIVEPTSDDGSKFKEQYTSSHDIPSVSRDSFKKGTIESYSQSGESRHFIDTRSKPHICDFSILI
jgi:chromosome segregation ATPase